MKRQKAYQALRATLLSAVAQLDAIEEAAASEVDAIAAIRGALADDAQPDPDAPAGETKCDHPKRRRLDARTMDNHDGWICGVCGREGNGEEE